MAGQDASQGQPLAQHKAVNEDCQDWPTCCQEYKLLEQVGKGATAEASGNGEQLLPDADSQQHRGLRMRASLCKVTSHGHRVP